jgi:flavin-binding protein dodecin
MRYQIRSKLEFKHKLKHIIYNTTEYIATKPFSKELFHIDAEASDTTDFIETFQSVSHSYNIMNISRAHVKTELKVSSNSERYDIL